MSEKSTLEADVLHVFEPRIGGVPQYVKGLSSAQMAAGMRVAVAAPPEVEPVFADIPVLFRPIPWPASRRSIAGLRSAAAEIHRTVHSDFQGSVVHAHSFFAGVAARRRTAPRDVAIVYQPHAWATEMGGLSGVFAGVIERALSSRTNAFALVSEDERRAGERLIGNRPAVTAGVGVDLDWYRPPTDSERLEARRRVGIDSKDLAVVCVGRVCRQKGQDLLVEAWSEDRSSAADSVRLVFVGEGRLDVDDANLRFVGPSESVRDWYWAADCIVQPSRWEGQSLSVAEAMACGCPVVASRAPGMQGAIDSPDSGSPGGRTFDVLEPGGPQSILASAIELASADTRARELSESARSRAELLFSWEHVQAQVGLAYEEARGQLAGV